VTRRLPTTLLLGLILGLVLSGCRWSRHGAASCTPPAGGRCAQDVAWSGPIYVTRDGYRLHQVIVCGGTLSATETTAAVSIRLHLGAIGAGAMSCAKVDVGVHLASPLGDRTVVDSMSGRAVRVVHGPPPNRHTR
jgi:hypothetical protein